LVPSLDWLGLHLALQFVAQFLEALVFALSFEPELLNGRFMTAGGGLVMHIFSLPDEFLLRV